MTNVRVNSFLYMLAPWTQDSNLDGVMVMIKTEGKDHSTLSGQSSSTDTLYANHRFDTTTSSEPSSKNRKKDLFTETGPVDRRGSNFLEAEVTWYLGRTMQQRIQH